MYYDELLSHAYLTEVVNKDTEIVLLHAGCATAVDANMVVDRTIFEQVLVNNRAKDPASEAVLHAIVEASAHGLRSPVWKALLSVESFVDTFTKLADKQTASTLGDIEAYDRIISKEEVESVKPSSTHSVPVGDTMLEEGAGVVGTPIIAAPELPSGFAQEQYEVVGNSSADDTAAPEYKSESFGVSKNGITTEEDSVTVKAKDADILTSAVDDSAPSGFATLMPDDDDFYSPSSEPQTFQVQPTGTDYNSKYAPVYSQTEMTEEQYLAEQLAEEERLRALQAEYTAEREHESIEEDVPDYEGYYAVMESPAEEERDSTDDSTNYPDLPPVSSDPEHELSDLYAEYPLPQVDPEVIAMASAKIDLVFDEFKRVIRGFGVQSVAATIHLGIDDFINYLVSVGDPPTNIYMGVSVDPEGTVEVIGEHYREQAKDLVSRGLLEDAANILHPYTKILYEE